MPFIKRKGQPTLHYEVDDHTDAWREAPVLILQHGYGRSAQFWTRWVPYLSRYYRVIRPNLRGLGNSPLEFDPYKEITTENFISDLLAVIAEVSNGPVHYCGESLGGILGIVLSAEHPEKVRTLSLVATPLSIPEATKKAFSCGTASWQDALRKLGSQGWAAQVNSSTRFAEGTDPALIKWYEDEMGKSNVDVLIALSELACKINVAPYLTRIKTPTLGLYASGGLITGPEESVIRKSIAGIKYVSFPTKFHSIQFSESAACATHVLHFAAQHDGIPCRE